MPVGRAPVEGAGRRRLLTRPQHPRRKDAVEEGLHQRGAEERLAALALELHSQRYFQGRPHRCQELLVNAGPFHPGQPVPRVGRQQPRHVFGFRQLCRQGQRPGQVLSQAGAHLVGERPRCLHLPGEVLRGIRQPEGFQARRLAMIVLAHQQEIPGVGHQHFAISLPVSGHLLARGGEPGVVCDGLNLDDAALRFHSRFRPAFLHLLGGVEAEVGMAGTLVGKFLHAEHPGLQRRAHGVQQVGQRHVEGALVGGTAGTAHQAQVGEVGLDGLFQFPIWHGILIIHRLGARY